MDFNSENTISYKVKTLEIIIKYFSIQNVLYHFNIGSGYDMSYIEAVGTVLGLLNVWYASREKIINFYLGIVNVTLFAVIFYQIQLYANLLLQIFFFAMSVYGIYSWNKRDSNSEKLKIRWLSKSVLLQVLIATVVAIIVLAYYIDSVFSALTNLAVHLLQLINPAIQPPKLAADAYPLTDSAIMVLSMVAMVLMTRKYVENWLLWSFINLLSIGLYAAQNVYLMSLEYGILFFIAAHGSYAWIREAGFNHNPGNSK